MAYLIGLIIRHCEVIAHQAILMAILTKPRSLKDAVNTSENVVSGYCADAEMIMVPVVRQALCPKLFLTDSRQYNSLVMSYLSNSFVVFAVCNNVEELIMSRLRFFF